jgi:hypothetical protein
MTTPDLYWWASVGAGLFAGLLTVAILGRWLRFVLALRLGEKSGAGDKPRQIRLFGLPLLALVSPVPWLFLLALPYAAYYFVHVRPSPGGTRFFCTLGIMVLVLAASLCIRYLVVPKETDSRALICGLTNAWSGP